MCVLLSSNPAIRRSLDDCVHAIVVESAIYVRACHVMAKTRSRFVGMLWLLLMFVHLAWVNHMGCGDRDCITIIESCQTSELPLWRHRPEVGAVMVCVTRSWYGVGSCCVLTFVLFWQVGTRSVMTETAPLSSNPVWNQSFQFGVVDPQQELVTFMLWGIDTGESCRQIGRRGYEFLVSLAWACMHLCMAVYVCALLWFTCACVALIQCVYTPVQNMSTTLSCTTDLEMTSAGHACT